MFLKDILQILKNTYEYLKFQIVSKPTKDVVIDYTDTAVNYALKSLKIYTVDCKNKRILSNSFVSGDLCVKYNNKFIVVNILDTLNTYRKKFHCYENVFLFEQINKKTIYDTHTKKSYNITKIEDLELICDILNKLRVLNLSGIRYDDCIFNKDEDKLESVNPMCENEKISAVMLDPSKYICENSDVFNALTTGEKQMASNDLHDMAAKIINRANDILKLTIEDKSNGKKN